MNRKLQNRIEVAGRIPPKEGEASDGDLIAELEASKDENEMFRCQIQFGIDPEQFAKAEFPEQTAFQIEEIAMNLANYLGRCRALYKK